MSEQGNDSVPFDFFTYVVLEQCTIICSGILYYSLIFLVFYFWIML